MTAKRSFILLFIFNLYYCYYELVNQSVMIGQSNILYSNIVNWNEVKNLVVEIKPSSYFNSIIKYEVYCATNQKIFIDQYNALLKTKRASIQLPEECNEFGSAITIYYLVIEQQNDLQQVQFEISFKASSLASVEKICPFNCSNTQNGICNEYTGVCKCNEYFTGYDCSFGLNTFSISNEESKIKAAIQLIKEMNYIGFISFKSIKACKLVVDNFKFLNIYRINTDNYQIYEEVFSPYNVVSFNIPNDDNKLLIVIQYFNNIQIPITLECSEDSNHYKLVFILCCSLSIPFTIIMFVISKKLYIKYKVHKQNKQESQNGSQNDVETQKNQVYNYIKQLKQLGKSSDRPFKQLINENENFKSITCSICLKKFNDEEQVHTTQQFQIYHTNCKQQNLRQNNKSPKSSQTFLQSDFQDQQDQEPNNNNQSKPNLQAIQIINTENFAESYYLQQQEEIQQKINLKIGQFNQI